MKSSKVLVFGVVLLLLIVGCETTEEKQEENVVELGKTVIFDYAAGFDNGTLFDTSFEDAARESGIFNPNKVYKPIEIVFEKQPLMLGLQEALKGMKEGELKNVRISPEKAYGIYIDNMIRNLSKENITNNEDIRVGDIITIVNKEGEKTATHVKEINEKDIIVDLNHPLAGQYVQFAIVVHIIE
jgi:peptidylprolyl isomerase|tara:strand:+ start:1813 stop:2367 length:555 start_codon:yes stop_codon:yes gene_type:complete